MSNILAQRLGKVIRELRIEKNISQKNFSKMLEVSEHTISRWEGGLHTPWPKHLVNIGKILHCEQAILLFILESAPITLLKRGSPLTKLLKQYPAKIITSILSQIHTQAIATSPNQYHLRELCLYAKQMHTLVSNSAFFRKI